MSDLPRTHLGPYRLEALLGQGGMGRVYRAVDPRLGRQVAIKQLPPTAAGDETRRRRFRQEAATLAQLSHPAIVQIFDLIEQDDGDWIVMELVEGPTVAELLARGPLPLSQVLDVGRQVAEGLGEAHDQGILHRDLKAENVMLRRGGAAANRASGRATILDFGLAKMLGGDVADLGLSRSDQILGTLHAMSPEQARSLPLDARSDLFSLGILLYEMTTGASPFRGSSMLETLQRITARPHSPAIERRPEMPPVLSKLIDRLLEKSPGDRPANGHQVAEELAQITGQLAADPPASGATPVRAEELDLEDSPTLDALTSTPRPSWWYLRRRRLPMALLLGAAVSTALVSLAVVSSSWRRAPDVVTPEVTEEVSRQPPDVAGLAVVPDAYALFEEGMAWLERSDKPSDLEQAIASFEAALTRDETLAAVHAGLALAYRRKFLLDGDSLYLEQALAVAEQAVRLDEHLALARIALGMANTLAGQLDEAQRELNTALQLDPLSDQAHHGLGELYRRQGRLEEAVAVYEKAVGLAPQNATLRDELGQVFYLIARYDEAATEILKGLELAPGRAEGYRDLSAVYYMQGRLPEAAEALQDALAIRPDHSLYSNLGTILFAQGLYPPAAQAFEKALQHGGANIYLYWANLGDSQRLMAGFGEAARESYLQAIELLRLELERTPERILLRSRLALYQAKRGDRDEALAELAQIERLADGSAEDLYRVAVAYEVCGRRSSALKALAVALEAGYPRHQIDSDPELFELRADPAFRRAVTGG